IEADSMQEGAVLLMKNGLDFSFGPLATGKDGGCAELLRKHSPWCCLLCLRSSSADSAALCAIVFLLV
ncbi:hypothetical protein MAY67_25265, partial [Escherichia coli]